MKIGGFQKTSLLDYPKHISCIVWTVKCNFNCPFCYNKDIVNDAAPHIPEEQIFDFLEKRKNMIEGVVITGGEPLLHKDIVDFISKIKKTGLKVKIDTNGTYPDKLQELIDKKLVDYIAMDVKAPKKKYSKLSGVKTDVKKIQKSIDIIKNSKVDYEFRTTLVPKLLKKEDIIDIAKWLDGSENYFLQQFKSHTPMLSTEMEEMAPMSKDEVQEILKEIKRYFKNCKARGV